MGNTLKDETQLTEYVNSEAVDMANMNLVITNNEEYEGAAETIKDIKRKRDVVLDFFKPMKDNAYKAHKEICAREKEMTKIFDDAEKALKAAMATYAEALEKERKAEEERLKAEAEAEKEKILAQALKLEEEGKTEEAQELLNTLGVIEDMGTDIVVEGEKPTANGAYATKSWEITNIDLSKVPCEVLGMIIRPVDEAMVKKLIRESKGTIQIPGITYKETLNVCVRK
ncbi:MAG: hypothetical protein LUD47_03250 [Clostridia bacterium]|nr:hypothetical protein [Clostridia bacterium]